MTYFRMKHNLKKKAFQTDKHETGRELEKEGQKNTK